MRAEGQPDSSRRADWGAIETRAGAQDSVDKHISTLKAEAGSVFHTVSKSAYEALQSIGAHAADLSAARRLQAFAAVVKLESQLKSMERKVGKGYARAAEDLLPVVKEALEKPSAAGVTSLISAVSVKDKATKQYFKKFALEILAFRDDNIHVRDGTLASEVGNKTTKMTTSIALLLLSGVDPKKNEYGKDALSTAATEGNLDATKLILAKLKADGKEVPKGVLPWAVSSFNKSPHKHEIAQLLMQHGADAQAEPSIFNSNSPLKLALRDSPPDLKMVNILLGGIKKLTRNSRTQLNRWKLNNPTPDLDPKLHPHIIWALKTL